VGVVLVSQARGVKADISKGVVVEYDTLSASRVAGMEIVLGWILFAVLVALLAAKRGRSGIGWFFVAIILSPVFAALLLLILQDKAAAARQPSPDTHVKCPDCRELVLRDARKCKHCGCTLVPQ
jgi:hypothetical protein